MASQTLTNTSVPLKPETRPVWFLFGCLEDTSGLTRISIGKVPFAVGRASSSDFRLSSRNVSSYHAQILAAGEAVLVRDLGSTNGTYVNGRRIVEPTPVGEGDLIQFADMEFRLGCAETPSGEHTAIADRPEEGWLISRMHEVVNQDRFEMAFQPIVSASDLRLEAVEALVRCDVVGLESPIALFEAATKLGLEERLSDMCRTKAVRALGESPFRSKLFLNTHPHEYLGAELVASLKRLRDAAANRPLVLEIHEAAVPELAAMREFRAALRDLGIGLAYDDFGAGQSRLLELTGVPPDYLKFDRSLVKDIATSSASHRGLLRSLLTHAADTGIATIAEGLDDQETADICREIGFTHFQGFHLGRPVFPAELPRESHRD